MSDIPHFINDMDGLCLVDCPHPDHQSEGASDMADQPTFDEQVTAAVGLVRDHPGVEHIWLNAFACIRPTDEFAAHVGRMVISKVMAHQAENVLERRHIVLRINAS